jgi:[ribosomal protein S5]-alanine N-acetyltransferase
MTTQKMPPTPVLQTPRLVLRPLRTKDAPVIQRRFPKWEVVRWLDARVPWPYPADGAATFVAMALGEMARGEKAHWAVVPRKGPADLIGVISLWPDDGSSRGQRGFWLDPEFQGQGLMGEAADRVTDYAFRKLDWPCLWLTNAQDNHASRRIKEKQGARLVDLLIAQSVSGRVSQMVWLLEREDWLARRPQPPAQKESRRLATTAFVGLAAGK